MIDPDRWLRVTVRAESDLEVDLASEALVAAGGAAVAVGPDGVTSHLPLSGSPDRILADVRGALERAGLGDRCAVDTAIEPARDWAAEWKRGLRPRRVGQRFLIHPTWLDPHRQPGDLCIALDPGMAFGTGEHATTRGALRLLEAVVRPGARVFDLGTGSGVLAIAAARLGAASVLATDLDPDAVRIAAENVRVNGAEGPIVLRAEAVDAGWLARAVPPHPDVIVANILSGVLVPLLPVLAKTVAPAGHVIVSGILEDEATEVLGAASRAGLTEAARDSEDGWWSATFSPSLGSHEEPQLAEPSPDTIRGAGTADDVAEHGFIASPGAP